MYLLDTSHCIEALDGDPTVLDRIDAARRVRIRTCVIVRAELHYMAHRSRRVAENIAAVEILLSGFRSYAVDDTAADWFGQAKAALFERFGPKDHRKQRHFSLHQLGISDNDLWIAAIALRHSLTVVTSDGDFARIAEVTDLRHESWLVAER